MINIKLKCGALGMLVVLLGLLWSCAPDEGEVSVRGDRPCLETGVYVWQGVEEKAVMESLGARPREVGGVCVLAVELSWTGKRFSEKWTNRRLPEGSGYGVVLRIDSSASSLEWSEAQRGKLIEVLRAVLVLGPSEVQIDYDCPSRRLAIYVSLMADLQATAGSTPLCPTVLPTWQSEPEFLRLVSSCPRYVLQVHSLTLPDNADDPVVICDPVAAQRAVGRAASLGVPFRVALPTYGCQVAFDGEGRVLDVISEDRVRPSHLTARLASAYADPVELSKLYHQWMVSPPQGFRGVIWYRLPVASDQRNWPMETWEAVIKGVEVPGSVTIEQKSSSRGRLDILVRNDSKLPARLPEVIPLGQALISDGAGPYRAQAVSTGYQLTLRPDAWPWLGPGAQLNAGWARTKLSQ